MQLYVTHQTTFKTSRADADTLDPSMKYKAEKGEIFSIAAYTRIGSHIKFTLDFSTIKGKNTWFVFTLHAAITGDNQHYKRKINAEGLALIKSFEGLGLTAYKCPAGIPTIGWGSTGSHVKMGMRITTQRAEAMLLEDLERFEECVSRVVKVKLTDNQFSSLGALALNIGVNAFESSTLLALLNEGKYEAASRQFTKWVRGGGKVLPGLVKRREAERELFLS